MKLWLEFTPDMAILHIVDGGERTEVRGHPGVGTVYEGSRLDRALDTVRDANFNLSVLHAQDILHIRSGAGGPIREFLKREEEIVEAMFASVMA